MFKNAENLDVVSGKIEAFHHSLRIDLPDMIKFRIKITLNEVIKLTTTPATSEEYVFDYSS